MDNQTPDSENTGVGWVDDKLSLLTTPKDWNPDSRRALSKLTKKLEMHGRDTGSQGVRLAMAAAILASIALVMALLPWRTLLKPDAQQKGTAIKAAEPTTPEVVPVQAPLSPEPKPPVAAVAPIPRKASTTFKQDPPPMPSPAEAAVEAEAALQATPGGAGQAPPERIGPGVTPPRCTSTPEPDYSDEARQAHIQGTVILSVIIRANGTVKAEKVVRGLGNGLDEKAIQAVERWKCDPGRKDGNPVDVQLQVTINFHLY